MFHRRNIFGRPSGEAATPAGVPHQNNIDNPPSSAFSSTIPYQHGGSSNRTTGRFLNENDETDSTPVPLSHHHDHHLLHMRLRGLGNSQHDENLRNDCVICAEAFAINDVVCQLPCGHIHHSTCILQWLDTSPNGTCPTCRQHISATPSATTRVGQPNDVADEDEHFNYETRRQCKLLLQKRQNFDLIMRRVLQAREEQRQLFEETTKQHLQHSRTHDDDLKSYLDNVQDQDATMLVQPLKNDFFDDTTYKLASSNHTRRTSIWNSPTCSSHWSVDDLEKLLNPAGNNDDDDDDDNNKFWALLLTKFDDSTRE
jgi:Ring finger domain